MDERKTDARYKGLLKGYSTKSGSRKRGHNLQSLVHQRSGSGLGDNDISSGIRKKVVRTNKDWLLIVIPACTGHIGRRPFQPACRPRRAIKISCLLQSSHQPPCAPRKPCPVSIRSGVQPTFRHLFVAEKTDLTGHPRKRLGGDISSCNTSAQAGVIFIFEIYEQHPYLGLVRRRRPFAILARRFLYRARALQYEVGR